MAWTNGLSFNFNVCVFGGVCIGGKQDDLEKVIRKKLTIKPSFLRHSGKEDSEKNFLRDQLESMETKAVEGTFSEVVEVPGALAAGRLICGEHCGRIRGDERRREIRGYPEQCGDESLALRDDFQVLAFVLIDRNRAAVHGRIHPEGLRGRR